jgi:uncharacterized protein YndB with AHSA1/START domain
MLTNADKIRPSGFTIDQANHTIRFERMFAAGREQVFAAWTQPAHVASWWDPNGEPLLACEIELKVGGAFKFVSVGHADVPFAGYYKQILPPEMIEFDAMGSLGRVTLKSASGGTHMTVEIVCASAEHLEQFVKMGIHQGTAVTLDNLAGYVDRESN